MPGTESKEYAWRVIVKKYFKMPDGRVEEYGTWDHEGAVCVALIGLTADNQVVLAKQYRPGPEKIMYEIPGGVADDGDTEPEKAAIREFEEETGYSAGRVEYLGHEYKDAYSNTIHHYFLAYDCKPNGQQNLDSNEFIDVELVSVDDFVQYAKDGKMTDSTAVLKALDKFSQHTHQNSSLS
jgi:ADP-ribose pyrophosphatase